MPDSAARIVAAASATGLSVEDVKLAIDMHAQKKERTDSKKKEAKSQAQASVVIKEPLIREDATLTMQDACAVTTPPSEPKPQTLKPEKAQKPAPTPEQQQVLDAISRGKDVFVTGPAGTGKSYTIGLILSWARECQPRRKKVALTATTGAAGALINGATLYSFLGIGLGTKSVQELVAGARKQVVDRVRAMDILVIDEVSMLSAELLDKVVAYVTAVRGRGSPFQLVLAGDFCQLPPVKGDFCFQATSWATRAPVVCQLTLLLRQSEDTPFQEMLMRLRWGGCSEEDKAALSALADTNFGDGIVPTRLHSLNAEVDRINAAEYAALLAKGAKTMSYARVTRDDRSKAWADASGVPACVDMCVGAQVMVTRNMPDLQLVNGSRGEVVALREDEVVIRRPPLAGAVSLLGVCVSVPRVTLACENEPTVQVKAMPVRLAYCLSIHKSQGVTLDAMEVDLGRSVFEYGQAYVALSRASSLRGVRVLKVDARSFRTHPDVAEFYSASSPSAE